MKVYRRYFALAQCLNIYMSVHMSVHSIQSHTLTSAIFPLPGLFQDGTNFFTPTFSSSKKLLLLLWWCSAAGNLPKKPPRGWGGSDLLAAAACRDLPKKNADLKKPRERERNGQTDAVDRMVCYDMYTNIITDLYDFG